MFNVRQVYLNGAYVAPERAAVSVFDRGFLFGDGVYEVIPAFGGRLFRLPQHLARLNMNLESVHLPSPHTADQWESILTNLVRETGGGDLSVYLQITRGVAARGHAFPADVPPTVCAYAQPLTPATPDVLRQGVAAITLPDIRWQRCDIKTIALLPNAMLRQQAIERGAAEAILVRNGTVTEGAASNIFIVVNGRLVTPPKGPYILPGITRDLVLELARAHAIPCAEGSFSEAQLLVADEIWMTSSTSEILPLTRINDHAVGSGRAGPVHARVLQLYHDYKHAFATGRVE